MTTAQTVIVSHGAHIGWLHRSEGTTTSEHCLPAHRLLVPMTGAVRVSAEGRVITSQRALWLAPNRPCAIACEGLALSAFFDLRQSWAPPAGATVQPLSAQQTARLQWLAQPGIDNVHSDAADLVESWLSQWPARPKPSARDTRAEHAVRWLEAHWADPWSMQKLARLSGLSPSHLAHLLKRDFGVSAQTFSAFFRARGAALSLASGQPAVQVAQASGFSDQPHMSRAFRRFFGKSGRYIQRQVVDRRRLP